MISLFLYLLLFCPSDAPSKVHAYGKNRQEMSDWHLVNVTSYRGFEWGGFSVFIFIKYSPYIAVPIPSAFCAIT